MANQSDLDRIEGTMDHIASQADAKYFSVEQELESLRNMVTGLQTENTRLGKQIHFVEEKQNFSDIKAKRLFLTIEGLADVTDINAKDQDVQKMNTEAEARLVDEDIISARRLGKTTKAKRSRNISLIVCGDAAQDKILKCRGKLSIEIPNTPIWIN